MTKHEQSHDTHTIEVCQHFFFTLLSLANTFTVLHLFCFPFKLVSPLNTVSSFLSANVLFVVWYQLPCCLRQCLGLIAKHLHMVLVKHDSHSCVSIAYLSSDFYLMCDIRVIRLWNSERGVAASIFKFKYVKRIFPDIWE